MARIRKTNMTKLAIIQVASNMFLEKGFSKTSAQAICRELEMSVGNLTYYFPTKEDILAVLVKMLCDFQLQTITKETNEGVTSLLALCLELTAIAAICEESEIAKDFYISAYTHPATLEIIRKSDTERAKTVFAKYTNGWTEEQFKEAETLISGILFGSMMTTETCAPLPTRIAGALNAVMLVYQVPEELRKIKIAKALSMNYRAIGKKMLRDFKHFVEHANECALEELLTSRKFH